MKMGLLLARLAAPDLAVAQQDHLGAVVERVSPLTSKDIPSLQQKAASGDPQTQFMLGLAYSMGAGVKTDAAKAFNWVSRAAESGHMLAENELGSMYASGEGVPKEDRKALEWFKKAAETGYAD